MSLEITYHLTQDDYRHGWMTWRTGTSWRKWNYRVSVAVMIVLFLAGILLYFRGPTLESKYFSIFALGMPAVWFLFLWLAPRIQARRQYRRMPAAQASTTLMISDSEMHVQSQHYDSRVRWSAYVGWAEGEAVFVLFPQPRVYVPIPKRAFSSEQIGQFREILQRNVGKK